MKTDPISKESFSPVSKEHFFKSKMTFEAFIERLDPVDELKETKREINWGPIDRKCSECGDEFTAEHPATMYCENCRKEKEEEENKVAKFSPVDAYEPREKECKKCENIFLSTKPAMKYCEKCSEFGGKVIKKRHH